MTDDAPRSNKRFNDEEVDEKVLKLLVMAAKHTEVDTAMSIPNIVYGLEKVISGITRAAVVGSLIRLMSENKVVDVERPNDRDGETIQYVLHGNLQP